jgi:hypothetical protein
MISITAQQHIGHGMKSTPGHILAGFIKQDTGSPQHLLGCPAGEGQKKNILRQNSLFKKMGNSEDQGACFTAAGSGNYKQWSFQMRNSLELSSVKVLPAQRSFVFSALVILR